MEAAEAMSTATRSGALALEHSDRPQETTPIRWSSAAEAPMLITGSAQQCQKVPVRRAILNSLDEPAAFKRHKQQTFNRAALPSEDGAESGARAGAGHMSTGGIAISIGVTGHRQGLVWCTLLPGLQGLSIIVQRPSQA